MISMEKKNLRKDFLLMDVTTKEKILDLKGGYRFAGNPEEIFERFFGTSNPFA